MTHHHKISSVKMHGLDTGQRQTDYKDPRPGLMFLCQLNKTLIEWFGTLIQLTYTSLAVQINKSKSIYYDHSAKTKNHRLCRAKLHILR